MGQLRRWGIPALIIAASALVFFKVSQFEFVTLDDASHVYRNPRIQSLSWQEVLSFFLYPFQGLYIPVTYLAWAVQIAAVKLIAPGKSVVSQAGFFHLVNLALHALNAVLVYGILVKVLRSRGAALLGAFVFAWHPLQVEAVAWVSALKDVLSGTFGLAAIWMAVGLGPQWISCEQDRRRYLVSSLCFVLALMSKPSAVMIPFMMAVLFCLSERRHRKETVAAVLPWLVLSAPFWIRTKLSQPDFTIQGVVSVPERLWIVIDTIVFYASKIVFPFGLSLDYGRTPESVLAEGWRYVVWLAPVLLFLLIRRSPVRRYWISGLALVVVYLVPVLGLVPFYYQNYSTVADRFAYLSLLGVGLVAGSLFAASPRPVVRVLWVVWILFLGVRSHDQLRHWRSQLTVMTRVAEIHPNPETFYSLGIYHAERGRTALAIHYYEKALILNPRYWGAENNLALLYYQRGDFKRALEHMRRAIEAAPYRADLYGNLGIFYLRSGLKTEAKKSFEKAVVLAPKSGHAHYHLGTIFEDEGQWRSAVTCYEQSVRLSPEKPEYRERLKKAKAKFEGTGSLSG